jgi:hypothetical protein
LLLTGFSVRRRGSAPESLIILFSLIPRRAQQDFDPERQSYDVAKTRYIWTTHWFRSKRRRHYRITENENTAGQQFRDVDGDSLHGRRCYRAIGTGDGRLDQVYMQPHGSDLCDPAAGCAVSTMK